MYEMNFFYTIWIFPCMIIEVIHLFDNTLTGIFNECFSLMKVKVSSRDLPSPPPPPPYMSPLVKHLCTIRNRNAKKCWPTSKDKWPNPQQPSGGSIQWNQTTWTGTKGWWNTVNKIIGRESKALKHQLCYQPWGHKPFLSNEIIQ